MTFLVRKTSKGKEFANLVYFKEQVGNYVGVKHDKDIYLFKVGLDYLCGDGCIAIADNFRKLLHLTLDESLNIELNPIVLVNVVRKITFRVEYVGNGANMLDFSEILKQNIKQHLSGIPISQTCSYLYKCERVIRLVCITEVDNGFIDETTKITLTGSNISSSVPEFSNRRHNSISSSNSEGSIFNGEFNFQDMGIGGLDEQYKVMLRRVFGFRLTPKEHRESLCIDQIKGILLFGLPGCGKTLIARQMAKTLKATSVQVVNGPELLDKYVGGSEEKIRSLFERAELDMKAGNDNFHVIIFDEIDSIAKKRGSSSGAGGDVGDKIVNQLLTKLDGVDSLNNILVIGMTNRKDMIDDALLRPKRLELHIEIGLPDEKGRCDILNIHTKKMKENGHLSDNVSIETIARETSNYTGAELEAIVKTAASYPLARNIDPITMKPISTEKPIISAEDFDMAIRECPPAFGSFSNEVKTIISTPFELYSEEYESVYNKIREKLIDIYAGESNRTKPTTILLTGPHFSGKTKMISHIVSELERNIAFMKFINPETMMRTPGSNKIFDTFQTCKTSQTSLLVLDSFENLIEYSPLGGSYNSHILQEIETILGAVVNKVNKIVIFITCSNESLISKLDLRNRVNYDHEIEDSDHITRFKELDN